MDDDDLWIRRMGDVAHDLKTPIAVAKGYIDLLQESGPLNEAQKRALKRAFGALAHMELLVATLLEAATIERDQPLVLKPCDLGAILASSDALLQDYAEARHVAIHTEAAPDLGSLEADSRQLEQVVLNLLSNAIKYNRKNGSVRVRATGTPEQVEVVIQDTGKGIAPEDLPHIFERFYRAERERREHVEGTGLGLAIVKAIIEKHGGRVWVESVLGEGTTFTFTLPRAPRPGDGVVDTEREFDSPLIPDAESVDALRDENVNEEIDAIDDNLQEPSQLPLDRDDANAVGGA